MKGDWNGGTRERRAGGEWRKFVVFGTVVECGLVIFGICSVARDSPDIDTDHARGAHLDGWGVYEL